jgi:hypothetical protein
MGRDFIPPFVQRSRPARLRFVRAWIRRGGTMVLAVPRRIGLNIWYFFVGCPEGCQHYWTDWLSDEEGAVRWCEKCGQIDLV